MMTNEARNDGDDLGNSTYVDLTIHDLDKLEMEIDSDGDLLIRDRSPQLGGVGLTIRGLLLDEFIADIQRARERGYVEG